MKNKIILSIIIPVYNAEKFIERLILSIDKNNQVEIITVDDGSTDSSKQIINELSKKNHMIKYFYKDNSGVSNTRNYGLEKAEGEYITFADADDFYEKDFINKLVNILTKDKIELLCFNYYKTYDNARYNQLSLKDDLIHSDEENNLRNYVNGYYSNLLGNSVWNKVYRNDILKKNKVLFPKKKNIGEDLIFNIRYIVSINSIKTLSIVGYNYYFNSNSVMNVYKKNNVHEIITSVNILDKLCREKKLVNYKNMLGKFYIRRFYGIFNNELASKDYDYAFKQIEKFCSNDIIKCINLKDLNYKELIYYIIVWTGLYKSLFKFKYKKGVGNMITVRMEGRIGNQMFQYWCARGLQKKFYPNDKIALDFYTLYKDGHEDSGYEDNIKLFKTKDYISTKGYNINLYQKFLLYAFFVSRKIYRKLVRADEQKVSNFERKLQPFLNKRGLYLFTHGYINFKPSKYKNKLMIGYFECDKYFDNVKEELHKEFIPKAKIKSHNKKLYDEINKSESICVTIRCGDFLRPHLHDRFYVCTPEYFKKSIEEMKKKVPNARFFVFSDDVEWCKKNLDFPKNTMYEIGNDGVDEKLRLMSACKHFIISNSTFSWWAQYLSKNDKKIVLAPDHWRNYNIPIDIYQNNWTKIKP